jgi:hypothetical protein
MSVHFHGRLYGKVLVVSGASRGIGAAIAIRLAEEGAKLVLLDVADVTETARAVTEAWRANSHRPSTAQHLLTYKVDVSDEAALVRVGTFFVCLCFCVFVVACRVNNESCFSSCSSVPVCLACFLRLDSGSGHYGLRECGAWPGGQSRSLCVSIS